MVFKKRKHSYPSIHFPSSILLTYPHFFLFLSIFDRQIDLCNTSEAEYVTTTDPTHRSLLSASISSPCACYSGSFIWILGKLQFRQAAFKHSIVSKSTLQPNSSIYPREQFIHSTSDFGLNVTGQVATTDALSNKPNMMGKRNNVVSCSGSALSTHVIVISLPRDHLGGPRLDEISRHSSLGPLSDQRIQNVELCNK